MGDLDQDGRDDLVMLAEKELIFVYQTATGVLSEPERVPHTATSPWLVKAIDIDGDKAQGPRDRRHRERPPDSRPVRDR